MRVHIFILMLFLQAQAAPAQSLTRYLNPVRPQDPEAPVQRWIHSLHQFLDRPVFETRNFRIGILPFGAIEIRFK